MINAPPVWWTLTGSQTGDGGAVDVPFRTLVPPLTARPAMTVPCPGAHPRTPSVVGLRLPAHHPHHDPVELGGLATEVEGVTRHTVTLRSRPPRSSDGGL